MFAKTMYGKNCPEKSIYWKKNLSAKFTNNASTWAVDGFWKPEVKVKQFYFKIFILLSNAG